MKNSQFWKYANFIYICKFVSWKEVARSVNKPFKQNGVSNNLLLDLDNLLLWENFKLCFLSAFLVYFIPHLLMWWHCLAFPQLRRIFLLHNYIFRLFILVCEPCVEVVWYCQTSYNCVFFSSFKVIFQRIYRSMWVFVTTLTFLKKKKKGTCLFA